MKRGNWVAVVLCAAVLGGCGSDTIDDVASLEAALRTAVPGDVLRLSGRTFLLTVPLQIPQGVALVGDGPKTAIVGPADRAALVFATGGSVASRLASLSVEGRAGFAVLVNGPGEFRMENARLDVRQGIGFGVQEAAKIVLTKVDIVGPVDSTNVNDQALSATHENSAAYGLVAVNVGREDGALMQAELTNVAVSGFALFGALLVNVETNWVGGHVSEVFGTGLMVHAGKLNLENVELRDTLKGERLLPPYAAVFAGASQVTTSGVSVLNSSSWGMLLDNVASTHVGFQGIGNVFAPIWVQGSDQFQLGGGSTLSNNGLAGVAAINSSNIDLRDVAIDSTQPQVRVINATPVQVADGVHLLDSTEGVSFRDMTLTDNGRVGLLLDVGALQFGGIQLSNITVSGAGEQLGAIAQGDGAIPVGWDAQITRLGAPATNDGLLERRLERLPDTAIGQAPTISDVLSSGLLGIVGPADLVGPTD